MVFLEDAGLKRTEKVLRIANRNPVFSYDIESIKRCAEQIVLSGKRRIPVANSKNELVGIYTYMDILDAFLRNEDLNESISKIMVREVVSCDENDSILLALQKMKISKRGGVPILSKRKIVGIVNERDFVKFFTDVKFDLPIKEVMTSKPLFVFPGISILDCLRSFVNTRYRRLPVVSNNTLIGLVTASDIFKYLYNNNFSFEKLDESLDKLVIKNPITVSPIQDVSFAIKLFVANNIGGVLVVEDSKLLGIITERNVLEIIE